MKYADENTLRKMTENINKQNSEVKGKVTILENVVGNISIILDSINGEVV